MGLLTPNPWDPQGALWPEYGDPYDIMSSATFGGSSSTFSRADLDTAVGGWPVGYWPNADMWYSMGPGLARAHVRHRDPSALVGRSVTMVDTGDAWSGSFTLRSAGIPSRAGTRLLIVRPRGASLSAPDDPPGTYYVEYRGQHGWDRGLAAGLSAPAVVLHQKADNGNGSQRIWFRGKIPVPLEAHLDLVTPAGELAVRVDSVSSDLSTVTVTLARDSQNRVYLNYDAKVVSRTEIEHQSVTLGACSTRAYAMSRYAVTTEGTFRASYSSSFGDTGLPNTSPRFRWFVGGKALAETGFGYEETRSLDGRTVMLFWHTDLDGRQLQFTNASFDGPFELEVQVEVSEADGSNALLSNVVRYAAVGVEDRYEDAYYEDKRECFRRMMSRLGFNPPLVLPPPGPGPDPVAVQPTPSLALSRPSVTVATLIAELDTINPQAAHELREFQRALAAEHSLLARLKVAPSLATRIPLQQTSA
jgi:hypothetical protein